MNIIDIIKSYKFPEIIEDYLIKSLKKNNESNNNKSNDIYDLIYEFSEYQESLNRWKNIKYDYDNC